MSPRTTQATVNKQLATKGLFANHTHVQLLNALPPKARQPPQVATGLSQIKIEYLHEY